MADRHLELGVFAPTIGCLPPQGKSSFMLVSGAEQRTEPTFDYNRRVAEMLDRAGLEVFFMAQRGRGFGPSDFWGTSLDSITSAAALAESGIDAVGLTFRHVEEEMADFIEKVLPLLEDMGIRQKQTRKVVPISRAVR